MTHAIEDHSKKILLATETSPSTALSQANKFQEVQLFADGACSGNPGPGGYAFLLRHLATGSVQEGSGAEPVTTNNRMELMAVIHGLEALDHPAEIELLTDSNYVGLGITQWMPNWKKNNWLRRERNRLVKVKNEDLWRQLDHLLQPHRLRFTHVPGHSGHPENMRCDVLAIAAYRSLLAAGPTNATAVQAI